MKLKTKSSSIADHIAPVNWHAVSIEVYADTETQWHT